jgi:hypothetical protein
VVCSKQLACLRFSLVPTLTCIASGPPPFSHYSLFSGNSQNRSQDAQHWSSASFRAVSMTSIFQGPMNNLPECWPIDHWLLAAVQDATTNNEPWRHCTGAFQGHIVRTGISLKTTNSTRRSGLSKFSAWFRLMGWICWMCLVVGTAYWPAHIC